MEERNSGQNTHLHSAPVVAVSSSSTALSSNPAQSQPSTSMALVPPISYRVNISVSNSSTSFAMSDETWSCLVVLVTFWFFASMTLILGFYGTVSLQLGPNCSRLLKASSLLVQEIKVKSGADVHPGPSLYSFNHVPPLVVETNWTELHSTYVPANFHKEWVYYLNKGSEINISYSVKSSSQFSVAIVIAQGKENFIEWLEDPSYPNITLSWNIVHGNGLIQQKIFRPDDYYIAVGNANLQEVEVELNFTMQAFVYNTTGAYYKCSLHNNLCILKLLIFGANAAVLATPGIDQAHGSESWYVKLSYGPRWVTYFVGSGAMTLLIFLVFKIISKCQTSVGGGNDYRRNVDVVSERSPLLAQKDDDVSSWGSSYGSISHDEEETEERAAVLQREGETSGEHKLCIICFNEPRDCFFLPCGHCAACFPCGTRIAEDAGTCPICRRKMRKVRKIFTV